MDNFLFFALKTMFHETSCSWFVFLVNCSGIYSTVMYQKSQKTSVNPNLYKNFLTASLKYNFNEGSHWILHIFDVYNLISLNIYRHKWYHHHNQGNRHMQCPQSFLVFWEVVVVRTVNMRSTLITNGKCTNHSFWCSCINVFLG